VAIFRTIIAGNHKFPKALSVLDVGDAIYDPSAPDDVIAFVHPAGRVWGKALIRVSTRSLKVMRVVQTSYGWGCGDLNAYPEEGVLLATHCAEGVVEFRDLESLELKRVLKLDGVGRVSSAALDSSGKLWVLSKDGLYVVVEEGAEGVKVRRVLTVAGGASMDSQRAEPARTVAVASYLSHSVLLVGEDGSLKASIPTPFPGGVRYTHDERLIVSSGRFPKHVQLTLVYGATHLDPHSAWFAYLWDYGTLASNRADSWGFERALIQWSLSAFEVPLPLPKFKPYVVPLGHGREGELLKHEGFHSFTPAPALGNCVLLSEGVGRFVVEALLPEYSVTAPQSEEKWVPVCEGVTGSPLKVPCPYLIRVRVLEGMVKRATLSCAPASNTIYPDALRKAG